MKIRITQKAEERLKKYTNITNEKLLLRLQEESRIAFWKESKY